MSYWGAPEDDKLTTAVQYAAFLITAVAIIFGLTAVSN